MEGVYKMSAKYLVGVWEVSARCVEAVLKLSWKCLVGVWEVSARCVEAVWDVSGSCFEVILKCPWRCLKGVLEVSGWYLEGVQNLEDVVKVCEGWLKGIWRVSARYLRGVWEVSKGCLEGVWKGSWGFRSGQIYKKILGPKFLGSNIFLKPWTQNFLEPKIFLNPKFSWTQNFRSKFFLATFCFHSLIFVDQELFVHSIFSCDEQLKKWWCHSVRPSVCHEEVFLSLKGVSRKF